MATEVEYVNYKDFVAGLESTENPGVDDVTVVSNETDGPRVVPTNTSALSNVATASDVVAGNTLELQTNEGKKKLDAETLLQAIAQNALENIKNLPTAITAFRTGDYIAVDGPSGTAKMAKDDLLKEAAQNALADNVALEFVPNSTNVVAGMPYVYNGKIYKSKENYIGPWDSSKFTEVVLSVFFAEKGMVDSLVQTDKDENIYFLHKSVLGRVNYKTGEVDSNSNFFYDTIEVTGYKCLSCQMIHYDTAYGLAFFDDNDNYIYGACGYDVDKVITLRIPDNAKYLKYCYYTDEWAEHLSRTKAYSIKFFEQVVPYSGGRNTTDGSIFFFDNYSYQGTSVDNCIQSMEYDIPEGMGFVSCSGFKIAPTINAGPTFFDKNWNFISGFVDYTIEAGSEFILPIPTGAKHFVFTYWSDHALSRFQNPIPSKPVEFIPNVTQSVYFDAESNGVVGSVNHTDGTINSTVTNNFTYDIEIPKNYKSVNYQVFKSGLGYGVAFLDSSKNFIASFSNSVLDSGNRVSRAIPDNAAYFRFSYLTASFAEDRGLDAFSGVTFEKEYMSLPTSKRHSFSVKVNVSLRVPDDTVTASVEDSYVDGTDYGYIQFPSNYSRDGKPITVVMVCHGAGASRDVYQSEAYRETSTTYWNNLGYAIFDMFAAPQEITGNSEGHYGNPAVLQCYKKGYDYIMKHFNVRHDGIVVHGSSMGGLSSFQVVDSGMFPVICQVANCPCIDLYKQAYCNPWSDGTYQRAKIAQYFNFTGTAPTFTNTKPPTQDEKDYFIDNFSKTIGFYPILKNVVTGDISSVLSYVPNNVTAESDSTEEALYSALTATHPVPIIVFHCKNDNTVAWRYSKYWVDMIRRSGQLVYFHSFSSGGHAAWDAGDLTNVIDVDGNTISLPAAKYEAYLFVKRFTD